MAESKRWRKPRVGETWYVISKPWSREGVIHLPWTREGPHLTETTVGRVVRSGRPLTYYIAEADSAFQKEVSPENSSRFPEVAIDLLEKVLSQRVAEKEEAAKLARAKMEHYIQKLKEAHGVATEA